MYFIDLLAPYEIRKLLLEYISAYDAAKLDACLGGFLDNSERKKYLKPIRDLIWDVADMEKLSQEGMRLSFFGGDAKTLKRRLEEPTKHLQKRLLRIYCVGTFPVQASSNFENLLQFSVMRTPCKTRIQQDKYQFELLQQRNRGRDKNRVFIMSLGAPTTPTRKAGLWYKVPELPDQTVDLRVYVPCFSDRKNEVVTVPFYEALPLSRNIRISLVKNIRRILCSDYKFISAFPFERQRENSHEQEYVLLRICPLDIYIELLL